MDGYQFIAALAAATAWPTAAVILGFTFHKPILALLGRITSVKAAGVEMTVGERSADAIEDLPSADADLPVMPPYESVADPEIDDVPPDQIGVSSLNPARATIDTNILRSWARLEAALIHAAPGPRTVSQSAITSIDRLLADDVIPNSVADSIRQLRRIRNDVAHGRTSVTMVDAMTYHTAVESVLSAIRLAGAG